MAIEDVIKQYPFHIVLGKDTTHYVRWYENLGKWWISHRRQLISKLEVIAVDSYIIQEKTMNYIEDGKQVHFPVISFENEESKLAFLLASTK